VGGWAPQPMLPFQAIRGKQGPWLASAFTPLLHRLPSTPACREVTTTQFGTPHWWQQPASQPTTAHAPACRVRAGSIVNWLQRTLCQGVTYTQLNQEAEDVPPGCDGLLALDHFQVQPLPGGLDWLLVWRLCKAELPPLATCRSIRVGHRSPVPLPPFVLQLLHATHKCVCCK